MPVLAAIEEKFDIEVPYNANDTNANVAHVAQPFRAALRTWAGLKACATLIVNVIVMSVSCV